MDHARRVVARLGVGPAYDSGAAAPTDGTSVLLFDRHVEKNGGSTFRSLLEQNSRHGRCVRGGNPRPWDVAEVSDALRRGQRVCAEVARAEGWGQKRGGGE